MSCVRAVISGSVSRAVQTALLASRTSWRRRCLVDGGKMGGASSAGALGSKRI